MARAKNSGRQYNDARSKLLKLGKAPLLLAPVAVTPSGRRKASSGMVIGVSLN